MNHQSEEDFMRDPLVTKTERTFRNKFRSKLLLLTVAVTFSVSILAFSLYFARSIWPHEFPWPTLQKESHLIPQLRILWQEGSIIHSPRWNGQKTMSLKALSVVISKPTVEDSKHHNTGGTSQKILRTKATISSQMANGQTMLCTCLNTHTAWPKRVIKEMLAIG